MTKLGRSRGFTLIEVLLAVGIAGVIAVTALAPLIFTIRSMEEAQDRWGKSHNAAEAVDRIYSDMRRVIHNPSFPVFRVERHENLSVSADDRLVVWSAAPKYEGRNAGVVIYKLVPEDTFRKEAEPGLYRWVKDNVPSRHLVSGDAFGAASDDVENPMQINTDTLVPEDGKLVLPGAKGVRFYIRNGKEWEDKYEGSLPQAVKTEVILHDGRVYTRMERFQNAETE